MVEMYSLLKLGLFATGSSIKKLWTSSKPCTCTIVFVLIKPPLLGVLR